MRAVLKSLIVSLTCLSMTNFALSPCLAQSEEEMEEGATMSSSPMLRGQLSGFGVLTDSVQNKMGLKCGTANDGSVQVTGVRAGSAAANCDIANGDRILDAHLEGDTLNLTIVHNNNIFRARLRDLASEGNVTDLKALVPKSDDRRTAPFTLGAEQQFRMPYNQLIAEKGRVDATKPMTSSANQFALQADQNFKILQNYNVELLVDRSMSMNAKDCPGGSSRWEWCGRQARDLAESLAPVLSNGLTIIPFATEYDVLTHASAQNIEYFFNNVQLQLGTRLFEPLAERLDNHFAHRTSSKKPLLIVVVTDGMPSPKLEPGLVRQELIESSQKMKSAGEVTVIFCQIGGNDRMGQSYLLDLDQNLVDEGARYHFVHTISFVELREAGLGAALAACINQYGRQAVVKPQPGKASAVKSKNFNRHQLAGA